MLKAEIRVGGRYEAKVNNAIVTVRVDKIRKVGGKIVYDVTNLKTNRTTMFRSAAKFRSEVVFVGEPKQAIYGFTKEEEQCSDPTPPQTNVNGALSKSVSVPTPSSAQEIQTTQPISLTRKIQSQTKDTSAHIEVSAFAGTGKTTCMIHGLIEAKGMKSPITPSDEQRAVWEAIKLGRCDSVRYSAFNSAITREATEKLEAAGLHLRGVEGKGIHALGKQAVCKAFPELRRFNLDKAQWVGKDMAAEALGGNYHDLRKLPGMQATMNAVAELVSYCKQTLTEPTREGLDELTSKYDIDLEGADRRRVFETVPTVLERSLTPKGRYNFDDMIWLTVKLGLPIERVDLQVIDESQDLNRMQQELMYRAGHRIVFVGDRHQAIYGFAGADSQSMSRMLYTLSETERGCQSLALTETRRCGKAIVEEARRYVPGYRAHASNPLGRIDEMRYPIQGTGEMRKELAWEQTYGPHVQPGSMVLCRTNAPLVSQCFRFLARGIRAKIQGKKIGEGLISLINSSKQERVRDLIAWTGDWLAREQANESAKRMPSESKLENLQDKHDCVIAFCEGLDETKDVLAKIDSVFTESSDNPGVKFSSGHKSKGLEARSVYILQPPGGGPRRDKMQSWELEQEDNLRYVMITRAIEELIYVS